MVNEKALDEIVSNTIHTMNESKSQIFDIYENARNEVQKMQLELEILKDDVERVMIFTEDLARREKTARQQLSEVSSDFSQHTEDDIKRSYEQAQRLQVELAIMREKEQHMVSQRNQLEIRLRQMEKTAAKAKSLVSKVGVILDYLSVHMSSVAEKLESANQDKMSAQMVIKAQENERLRVSQEIHDGPAQLIANILYRASVCEAKLDSDVAAAKEDIHTIKSQIRDCLAEIRQIIFDLRPMTLDDLGLVAAIYHFIKQYERRTGFQISFDLNGSEYTMPKYTEIGLFRIIQEGINNVYKHSGVNNAHILLKYEHKRVRITIKDQGKGFDALAKRKAIMNGENESYGLLGILERVKILNGTIDIDSEFGRGTELRISIPLEKTEEK